jgi:hypothetical protein
MLCNNARFSIAMGGKVYKLAISNIATVTGTDRS